MWLNTRITSIDFDYCNSTTLQKIFKLESRGARAPPCTCLRAPMFTFTLSDGPINRNHSHIHWFTSEIGGHWFGRMWKTSTWQSMKISLLCVHVICCSGDERSGTAGWHRVRCLWGVFRHQEIRGGHTQSTRWRYSRRRNEGSHRHRSLPPRPAAVRRRQLGLHLASVGRRPLLRELAADRVTDAHVPIPRLQDVADVTRFARDVIAASCSVRVQHSRRTAAEGGSTAAVRQWVGTRRWNVAWYVCRRSPRHVTGQVAARGQWHFFLLSFICCSRQVFK